MKKLFTAIAAVLLCASFSAVSADIRVWVRFRTDISASSRLKVISGAFKHQVLEVTGPPIPDSGLEQLEILCKQGVKP